MQNRLSERYLLTKSAMYLEDDDGEDSDLVGFYSDDYKSLPKDTLRRLGYKMAANEAGELEVVNRCALHWHRRRRCICRTMPPAGPCHCGCRAACCCCLSSRKLMSPSTRHVSPALPLPACFCREESELPSEQAILEFLDNPGLDAQVNAWVSDLLDDEEDEAEVPMRAYRAPVVAAASVVGEWLPPGLLAAAACSLVASLLKP